MNDPDVRHTDPGMLSRLMALDADEGRGWSAKELGDILRHQLRAPLLFDLGKLSPAGEVELRHFAQAGGRIENFGDLLHHPAPPVELLSLVKEFGKSGRTGATGLPQEIATVLYYASIAAALVRHGRRITRMEDKPLRDGLKWAAEQPWVDDATRLVLKEGLAAIR